MIDEEDAPTPGHVAERRAQAELATVYARVDALLAPFSCPASADCCRFPNGREPFLMPVEFRRLQARLARDGRTATPTPGGGCPLLDAKTQRCTVYADRPFGCRTFFCDRRRGPGTPSSDALNALTARLTRLSDGVDPGAAPRRLTEWLGLSPDPR